jgi:hypothetical protein
MGPHAREWSQGTRVSCSTTGPRTSAGKYVRSWRTVTRSRVESRGKCPHPGSRRSGKGDRQDSRRCHRFHAFLGRVPHARACGHVAAARRDRDALRGRRDVEVSLDADGARRADGLRAPEVRGGFGNRRRGAARARVEARPRVGDGAGLVRIHRCARVRARCHLSGSSGARRHRPNRRSMSFRRMQEGGARTQRPAHVERGAWCVNSMIRTRCGSNNSGGLLAPSPCHAVTRTTTRAFRGLSMENSPHARRFSPPAAHRHSCRGHVGARLPKVVLCAGALPRPSLCVTDDSLAPSPPYRAASLTNPTDE